MISGWDKAETGQAELWHLHPSGSWTGLAFADHIPLLHE